MDRVPHRELSCRRLDRSQAGNVTKKDTASNLDLNHRIIFFSIFNMFTVGVDLAP